MKEEETNMTALTASLEGLDEALGEFQKLIAEADDKFRDALVHLDADDVDLNRLGSLAQDWLSQVDVFRSIGLDDKEEFHSNFLAWLLSPKGSHGLGTYFLQALLRSLGWRDVLAAATVGRTAVTREHGISLPDETGRLDIRILNEDSNFVCAIENKVRSPESGSQLAFYRKALEAHFSGYRVERVFLTPTGALPEDPREQEHWSRMTYKDILGLVEQTLQERGEKVHEDVRALLRQYATTLRRNIVPEVSDEVHRLARQIYRKHKQAIDLIIQHRERYEPNYVTEGFRMVRDAVGERPEWRESRINHPYARFVAAEWADIEEFEKDGWPDYILQFQVHVSNRGAVLSLFLDWRDNGDIKKNIFEQLGGHSELFTGEFPVYVDDYITLNICNILEETDYETWWDEDKTRETISSRLKEFAQSQFPTINSIVMDCLNQHREKTQ